MGESIIVILGSFQLSGTVKLKRFICRFEAVVIFHDKLSGA